MSSTNLKNACGMYKLEQSINNNIENQKLYKGQSVPRYSKFANLGINSRTGIGGYYNNVLSNNTTDIESSLYGIGSSNLVEKKEPVIPQLNKLGVFVSGSVDTSGYLTDSESDSKIIGSSATSSSTLLSTSSTLA